MILKYLKQRRHKEESAFTLVEIIVILFIVSVGMIGILSLVIQNIQSQIINKNNITAYQLAQEGLELVRKTRDTNWLNGYSWNEGLAAGTYYMDFQDDAPQLLGSSGLDLLYQDSDGFYVHDNTFTATRFSRQIEITDISSHEKNIKAVVSWGDRNQSFTYNLETRLYDWYY